MKKREILFRGKSVKSGEWVYGDALSLFNPPAIISHRKKDNGYDEITVFPKSIGQFIGIKNKKKKIFEGDILKCSDFTSDKWILDNSARETCVVNYIGYRCAFHPQDIYKNHKGGKYIHYWDQISEVEIIGNVYDNPELLRKKNNRLRA